MVSNFDTESKRVSARKRGGIERAFIGMEVWMVTVYVKKMIKDHEAFQAMHSADQKNRSQLNASRRFAVQCQVTSGISTTG